MESKRKGEVYRKFQVIAHTLVPYRPRNPAPTPHPTHQRKKSHVSGRVNVVPNVIIIITKQLIDVPENVCKSR